MSKKNIEESETEETPPQEIPVDPMSHITEVKMKDPTANSKEKELEALDRDSYVPQYEAVIVINALPKLKDVIAHYEAEMKLYNDKLAQARCKYRIRPINSHEYRHKIYYYFGNYIYQTKSVATTATKNKSKKKYGDWEYVAKFDDVYWATIVDKEIRVKIGSPPRKPIPNINFHVIKVGDKETDCIIMPYLLFMNPNTKSVIGKCPNYRISQG